MEIIIIIAVSAVILYFFFKVKEEPRFCPHTSEFCKSMPKRLDMSCTCGRKNNRL